MTAMAPIEVFAAAAERGLKLGLKPPHTLTVQPANRCPQDFADTLSQHKWRLLAILQLPFVMAYSKTLGETIFLCEDEDTKAALEEAGAERLSIYTRDELAILIEHNRARPFIPSELCKLHETRKTFHGRLQSRS